MNILKPLFFLFTLLYVCPSHAQQEKNITVGSEIHGKGTKFVVTGKIKDFNSNESLPGCNVIINNTQTGTVTDAEGVFELLLPKGKTSITISLIGYQTSILTLQVLSKGSFTYRMEESEQLLEEVVVSGYDPTENLKSVEVGKLQLSVEDMKTMPRFLGEVDVIKSIAMLPGIVTAGEASSGYNVRGGSADQNLILLGSAPIYNPSHLFGFLTAFNSNALSNVTLHRAGIPSKFGGRCSSIMDISYKKGDFNDWSGLISTGTTSTNVTASGPLIKDRLSLLVATRASHINWLFNTFRNPSLRNSNAFFADGNLTLTAKVDPNNSVQYSLYKSIDDAKLNSDTTLGWGNTAHSLEWRSSINGKLHLEVSSHYSRYAYNINNQSGVNDFKLTSGLSDAGGRVHLSYSTNEFHTFEGGIQSKFIRVNPGELIPDGSNSAINPLKIQDEQATETGLYSQYQLKVGKLLLSAGVRYDIYNYLGSRTVNTYTDNQPRSESTIESQTTYGKSESIKHYTGLAPRAALQFSITENASIKAGYNKTFQFIQLVSNSAAIAPTDIWKLSDSYIKPQEVEQYTLGFYKNFKENVFETSLEGYTKTMKNLVDYKNGAELLLSPHLETELLNGDGVAYGAEFYAKKNRGDLTGWVSYTYSRSFWRVVSPFENETVNKGDWYNANYDKPHNLSLVLNLATTKRSSLSANFSYSTGRPVTVPTSKFDYTNTGVAYFSHRNNGRMPDYHRLDLSFTFSVPTTRKLLKGDWTISVINVYSRNNAYSVYFNDVAGAPAQAYKLSVVTVPLPSFNYTVKL